MKTPTTYNLIIQSEEKNRAGFETLIYALLTVSAVVSIVCAAVQHLVLLG